MTDIGALLGTRFDNLDTSVKALPRAFREEFDIQERTRARTKKFIRIPILSGVASSGKLALGGDTGEQLISPEEGYVWSLRELNIEGLTASATAPDVVNIYRNTNVQGKLFWQLNGNVFAQTWGRGEKMLFPGDSLYFVNLGTFAATGTISVSGLAMEVAAERIGEFF